MAAGAVHSTVCGVGEAGVSPWLISVAAHCRAVGRYAPSAHKATRCATTHFLIPHPCPRPVQLSHASVCFCLFACAHRAHTRSARKILQNHILNPSRPIYRQTLRQISVVRRKSSLKPGLKQYTLCSPCENALTKNPKTKNAYFSTCTPSPALVQARSMAAAALSCAFTAGASR